MDVANSIVKSEYQRSAIPVFEVKNILRWLNTKKALKKITNKLCAGMYIEQSDLNNYPEKFILINKNQPNYDKLSTLFHEQGHWKCCEKTCLCKKSQTEGEYHADFYCLNRCISLSNPLPLFSLMYNVILRAVDPETDTIYANSAAKLIHQSTWRNIMSVYNKPLKEWIFEHDYKLLQLANQLFD